MDRIVEVTGGMGGNAFLVRGAEKTALIDCGMAYCASNLIRNIQQALDQLTLDYILISHSHYDHISAIPYLKKEWPHSRVLGAEYAKRILQRSNALKTIQELNRQAAILYGANTLIEYDDNLLMVDDTVRDGDLLELGGLTVQVIKTEGHTRCSLSFWVNDETLFASESSGCMTRSGKICPAFITSFSETINSIGICQKLNPRFIISPHFGLVDEKDTPNYWENCLLAAREAQELILHFSGLGYDEQAILDEYEKVFRDASSEAVQPRNAFLLNTRGMIKNVLREKGQGYLYDFK